MKIWDNHFLFRDKVSWYSSDLDDPLEVEGLTEDSFLQMEG